LGHGGRRFRAVLGRDAPRGPVGRRGPVATAAPGLPVRHLVGPLEIQQVADVFGLLTGRLAVPDVFLVLDRGRQLLDDVPAATTGVRARLLLQQLLLLFLLGYSRSLLLLMLLFGSLLLVFGSLLLVRQRLLCRRRGRTPLVRRRLLYGRHQRVVLAGGRGRRHSRSRGGRRGRTADGRRVVRAVAVFALVAAVVVLEQRQPLALVLGLGRPLEHGEYLAEQLPVLGRLPEPALHGAGVVVDAEPAVVAVRYRAQERTGEERLRLRALVARLVRKARRRRRFRLGVLAIVGPPARRRPSLGRHAVVAAVVAVGRVAVKRRELPRHLQLLV